MPEEEDAVPLAVSGLVEGDLLAAQDRRADARAAWTLARERVRPITATGSASQVRFCW